MYHSCIIRYSVYNLLQLAILVHTPALCILYLYLNFLLLLLHVFILFNCIYFSILFTHGLLVIPSYYIHLIYQILPLHMCTYSALNCFFCTAFLCFSTCNDNKVESALILIYLHRPVKSHGQRTLLEDTGLGPEKLFSWKTGQEHCVYEAINTKPRVISFVCIAVS